MSPDETQMDANGRPIVGPADAATRKRLLLQALRAKGDGTMYKAPAPTPEPPVNKGGGFMKVEKALKDAGA